MQEYEFGNIPQFVISSVPQKRPINDAFRRAIDALGGQVRAAKFMNRTQSAISKRLKRGDSIWTEVVIAVEAETGISRFELRPDIYPIEEAPLPGTPPGGTSAEPTQRSAGVPESLKGLQS